MLSLQLGRLSRAGALSLFLLAVSVPAFGARLEERARSLNERAGVLLLQAQHPSTLSVGKVDRERLVREAESFAAELLAWKTSFEEQLSSDVSVDGLDEDILADRLQKILFYFSATLQLAQIQQVTEPARQARDIIQAYSLQVPEALFASLAGRGDASSEETQVAMRALYAPSDRASIVPEFGGPGEAVRLKFGRRLLENILAKTHAAPTPQEALLRAAKLLATSALYDDFQVISDSLPEARPLPKLPLALAEALGSSDIFRVAQGEIAATKREEAFRNQLGAGLEGAFKAREFATEDFTRELSLTILEGSGARPDAGKLAAFRTTLAKLEAEGFVPELDMGAASGGLPLLPIVATNPARVETQLRDAVARAKFLAVVPAMQKLNIPEGRIEAVADFLKAKRDAYAAALPSETLRELIGAAVAKADDGARDGLRRTQLEHLRETAYAVEKLDRSFPADEELDPLVLLQAINPERFTPAGKELAAHLVRAKDNDEARAIYRLGLQHLQAAREDASQAELKAGYVRDEEAFRALGEAAGFDRTLAKVKRWPALGALGWNAELRQRYLELLRLRRLGTPVLNVEIGGAPLYRLLQQTKNDDARARDYVDIALAASAEQIEQNLARIGDARTPGDLGPLLVRSSFLRELIEKAFPQLAGELRVATQASFGGTDARKAAQEASHTFTGPLTWVMPLFILEMGSLFLRPTMPFMLGVHALKASVAPHITGYLLASLPFLVANVGFAGWETYETSGELGDVQNFFVSGAMNGGLFDATERAESEARQHVAKFELSKELAMQAVFLGAPFLAHFGRRFYLRAQDSTRTTNFAVLGAGPSHAAWNRDGIRELAFKRLEEAAKPGYVGPKPSEIAAAKKSLLRTLQREEAKAARLRQDLGPHLSALGLSTQEFKFNADAIETAYQTMRTRYESGNLSDHGWKRAQRARVAVMRGYAATAGTAQVSAFERWRKGDAAQPDQSRLRLLQEVYGFDFSRKSEPTFSLAKDYYQTLNVPANASEAEIKFAYRREAMASHPDRHPGDKAAEARFQEVNEAYQVLGKSDSRSKYDRGVRGGQI